MNEDSIEKSKIVHDICKDITKITIKKNYPIEGVVLAFCMLIAETIVAGSNSTTKEDEWLHEIMLTIKEFADHVRRTND